MLPPKPNNYQTDETYVFTGIGNWLDPSLSEVRSRVPESINQAKWSLRPLLHGYPINVK